ncbi:VENN motif pre-toxin domain-containing protein, partial [Photorhabdus cinerea]|uniref:VENN motif pre-toxin domain-containing protein n=1 Tax=Photorhabdus cinerea TaxID=471575 RepID=UPI001F60F699
GAKVSELSEEQKQTISTLSTLAAGLAGGIAGDSTASALTGAQAGKNAIENNALSLPKGMMDYGRSASSLATAMLNEGKSPQEISAALSKHAKGDHPEGQDPARGLLVAWGAGASAVGGTIVGPIAGAAAVIGGGILGGATDATKQLLTLKPGEHYSATDTLIAVGTGALTQGKGTLFSTLVNTGGAYLGSKVKGEDPTTSMLGNAVGTVIGNKVGGKFTSAMLSKGYSNKASEIGGTIIGNYAGTATDYIAEKGVKKTQGIKNEQ